MTEIGHVPTQEVNRVWPVVEPYLAKAAALSRGRMAINDIFERLIDGRWSLMVAVDGGQIIGALTLRIVSYPRMNILEGLYLAGEVHRYQDWLEPMNRAVDEAARKAGCAKVEFVGLPGWGKMLEATGYERTFVCYEKAVSP